MYQGKDWCRKGCYKSVQARNIQKTKGTMESYINVLSSTYYHHLKQNKTKVWLVVYDDGGYFYGLSLAIPAGGRLIDHWSAFSNNPRHLCSELPHSVEQRLRLDIEGNKQTWPHLHALSHVRHHPWQQGGVWRGERENLGRVWVQEAYWFGRGAQPQGSHHPTLAWQVLLWSQPGQFRKFEKANDRPP